MAMVQITRHEMIMLHELDWRGLIEGSSSGKWLDWRGSWK